MAGRDYSVPVRIWADTKYGVLAILAHSVKVDGKCPKALSPESSSESSEIVRVRNRVSAPDKARLVGRATRYGGFAAG